jgi:cellulose synthase operon protein C
MDHMQPRPRVVPAPDDLRPVLDLYRQGLCLQAYRRAEALRPLRDWAGAPARVLAGRLAINLGAPRLAFLMHLRGWREDRSDPEACYYHARALLERRGPLTAWRFLRRQGDLPEAPADVRSDWLAFHAAVLGRLRDFDAAEAWLDRAEAVCPGRPWTCLERAFLLEQEDRYAEALAAARRALELHPWYRPGVQAAAHALQLLDRDGEALELLTEGARRLESSLVLAQLATLQTELAQHADACRSYERFAELAPLMDKDVAEWLAARRSDAAYYCGDLAEAAARAREVHSPFHDRIAEKLSATPFEGKRVLLEVGFVRQHYQTCAPATLAAVSRFWKMAADHLEVAAAICYDGTPDHRERAWAEDSGWAVREFTVTWDSAAALIDRGVPFTLTTIDPGNAHLQAVIGYDTCRNTLIVRDPYQRNFGEFIADTMLEHYRSVGPRGMALVPAGRAELLDGLDLPDAALYDRLHRLQRALFAHDRARAAAAFAEMREAAPDHRLTWQAGRVLALYDADAVELLASVEGLLRLFPDDGLLLLGKLSCLRELGRRDERLAILQVACDRTGPGPIFWRQYAQELLADAREHPRAIRLLRRAIRYRPYDEGNFATLANLLCDQRRFEEAMELYRFAACLGDKDEGLARCYFAAARHLRRQEETLRFLDRRFRRFGARSSQPARTLYQAYGECERTTEALAVLEDALKLRPDDGDLLLFAAGAHVERGEFDRAAELLARAEGRCPRAGWLRTSANLAAARGDLAGSLALWRQVVEAEPLALDANRAVAQLLAETGGRPDALEHLQNACARFPHNYALHQLRIMWLRDEGPAVTEPVIRQLLAIHAADGWGRRELALCLSDQGRLEEAFAELEAAGQVEPLSPSYWNVRGGLCERAGRRLEAQQAYREAIRLSVDNDFAIGRLMDTCETRDERRAALAFIEAELERQVVFGDGLLAYQQYAQGPLEPEELLASVRKGLEARPDLWHAWSAVIRQLSETGRAEEARDLARQACARFPLLPRLWFDLGVVCRACGDEAGELEALEHTLQISPGWGLALRRLSEVHERAGRLAEARAVLERAVAREPLEAQNHGCLADILWQLGEKDAALERLLTALRLGPGYEWGWNALREWAAELGRPAVAADFARELTVRRPAEARSWLMLARTLSEPADLEERLAALDRAAALSPRCVEAYDQKAMLLARAGRFDEARAVCQAAVWDGKPPLLLRGRAAWVEAQRGRPAGAMALMKTAVAEDPDYAWGWQNLTEWSREHAAAADYREAAESLVRLMPQNAMAHGYRGEARARAGDRAGAKADFRRALELAPDYGFAALALFDEQFADGELDDAAATLAKWKERESDEFVVAREVQLAARRADRAGALKGLKDLCVAKADSTWPLDAATAAMRDAGWEVEVEAVLAEALRSDEVHPHAAELWVERWAARRDWGKARRLGALLGRGEVGRRALVAYVKGAGKAKAKGLVRACARRYGGRLRGDGLSWGMTGYALTNVHDYRGAAAWLADWDQRQDVQPWVLLNLVLSLRALGRDAEANRASRRALELPPDGTTANHSVWLAFDEAVGGNRAEAAKRLAALDASRLDATHRYLHGLIEAVLSVQQAAAADRGAAFKQARQKLSGLALSGALPSEDRPAVRHAYRLCVRRLAHDRGGWTAELWGVLRELVPVLPKVAGK